MAVTLFWLCLILCITGTKGLALKDESASSLEQQLQEYITAICPGDKTTNDSTGTLQSPNFPSGYGGSASCYFYIKAPYGSNIQININYLSFKYDSSYGYLSISNSTTTITTLNMSSGYNGNVDLIYSAGNVAQIYYNSVYSIYVTFQLTWKTIKVSECQGPDVLFLLDRSQAIFANFYNTNIKNFLRSLTKDYFFTDDLNSQNYFSSRFGIIEFSDNATVTVPLKQYSRTDFLNQISYNVSYGDGGDSNVTAALSLAFDEFSADGTPDENGYHVPRLIVLVVNDISQFGYKNTVAAMDKLKTIVQFPTGVIIPGIPGIPSGAQDRLAALIGNENYTFGSLDSATTGIPTLTNNLNCPFCSNLIFICEMTVAIGYDQKLECLKLAQKLASVTVDNEKKRYAIGTYGVTIYNNIQLQKFSDFNETINKLIDTVTTDNQPNGGQTYLASILNQLYDTLNTNYTTSKAVSFTLIMGELSAIRDPNPAMTAARKVASLFTDIYVLDESRIGSLTNLWPTLTNNLPGHIVNGTLTSDNDSLFATFNTTLLQDYRQIQC
jgi:hypothetical protein